MENALEDAGIRLFEGADILKDTSFDLDEIDFQKLRPAICLSLVDPDLWMPKDLARADLELLLIARNSFLKRSDVIERVRLDEALPTEWEIDPERLADYGGGRNLQLTIALCLATDRQPKPGIPFLAGHWLARKVFYLRSRTLPSLFDVRTRSDEEWVSAGYPAKTLFTVEYTGGIEVEAEDGSSVATVYLHVEAYNRMVGAPIGDALQPLLASEIIATVLLESARDWERLEIPPARSPLATVLKQFEKSKSLSLAELRALVAKPALLRAELQDRLNVVRSLI